MSSHRRSKRSRSSSNNSDDDDRQIKKIKTSNDDDLNSTSSSTITLPQDDDNDDDYCTPLPPTPPQLLNEADMISAGGDSPYFTQLDEPIDCDETTTLSHQLRLQSQYHRYSAIDYFSGKIHCRSVLCQGLQVDTWHNSMNDCINNLIDNRDRVKEIDWTLFGKRLVEMIWDEEEYLEAYDRLRKTFKQRFFHYYHTYMEALPDDAHIRAIRSRYSLRHLTKLSYYDIHWWKKYIIWGDVLDDLDYLQQYNTKYWLQAYQSLLVMMSKIPAAEAKVDSTGKPISFPLAYHPLSLKFKHRLFHKPPPFLDGCVYCRQDQERFERFEIYKKR